MGHSTQDRERVAMGSELVPFRSRRRRAPRLSRFGPALGHLAQLGQVIVLDRQFPEQSLVVDLRDSLLAAIDDAERYESS